MEDGKYIVFMNINGEEIIRKFSRNIYHDVYAEENKDLGYPVSAGFYIKINDNIVKCSGFSCSLNMYSREDVDARLFKEQLI